MNSEVIHYDIELPNRLEFYTDSLSYIKRTYYSNHIISFKNNCINKKLLTKENTINREYAKLLYTKIINE